MDHELSSLDFIHSSAWGFTTVRVDGATEGGNVVAIRSPAGHGTQPRLRLRVRLRRRGDRGCGAVMVVDGH